MKFFTFISLTSAFLLFFAKPFDQKSFSLEKKIPTIIRNQRTNFVESFKASKNANISWSLMTGEKIGIPPKILQDFKDLELSFLFSPSGIHLTSFLTLLFFVINKFMNKKTSKKVRISILMAGLFLPYLAIRRIIILRLLIISQRFIKMKASIEVLFLLTFFISFLLNHYNESPNGFILSFLFIGTFISLRDRSRIDLILGLLSSHLLIAFFWGNNFSLLSLIVNIPIIAFFSLMIPFAYFYLFTFKIIHFNWLEPLIKLFILIVHEDAKLTQGSFVSATIFLISAVWIILLRKNKIFFLIALLLHCNAAQSPTYSYQGSYSAVLPRSGDKLLCYT